ncbi:MAG TPA: LysM peptidoglycan-binding domain-containing protein [Herpetosiphonaceae bacterium]|nr:LysM peptidoglycan-binding domain-containing protein [Herpetosiphonaceae bacterium]
MPHSEPRLFHRMHGAALLIACVAIVLSSAGTVAASAPTTTDDGLASHVWSAPIGQSPSRTRMLNPAITHVIRRGETLTRIARRYGVTVAMIVQANGLPSASRIYAGQRLVIPTPGSAPAPSPATTGSTPAPSPATTGTEQVTHVVRRGETLWGIARRYGVSVDAIAQANGLANVRVVYARQRLVIPAGGDVVAQPGGDVAVPPPGGDVVAQPGGDIVAQPSGELTELAAIVYAEARANPVDFEEMLAVASVVRNRAEHVAAYPGDQRSFGGPGYHGVLSNRREFPSYDTPRYRRFLAGTISSGLEQIAAQAALRAATQVYNGGAPYTFVFFQKSPRKPSLRAANPAVHLGAHNFWSFRPECVSPYVGCGR